MSVQFLKTDKFTEFNAFFLQENENDNLYNREEREKHCHFVFDQNKSALDIFSLKKKLLFFPPLEES